MSTVIIVVGVAVLLGLAFVAFRGGSSKSAPGGSALVAPRDLASHRAAGRKNWLVGIGGEVEGKNYYIGQRMVTVGRTPQNAIQITDAAASRTHCQIRPMGDWLQVTDMRSRNATYINGEACKGTGRMDIGDELSIGKARFVFKLEVDAARDDMLGGKAAGPGALKPTAAMSSAEPVLQAVVVDVLRQMNGDVDAAAKRLGITAETLRKVVAEVERQDQ